uniref:Uncharacterized protein n=1 Tax=Bactrocera latifrons TaxID=174628 RepID=A0A0K8WKQ2_BACLA
MSLDNKPRFGALAMLAKSLNLEALYKKRKQQVTYYDIYTPDASDTEDEEQTLRRENLNETPSSNKSSKKKRETDAQMASTTTVMRQIKRRRLSYKLEDEK